MKNIDLLRAMRLIAEQEQVLVPKDKLSRIIASIDDDDRELLDRDDLRQISAARANPEYRKGKDHNE